MKFCPRCWMKTMEKVIIFPSRKVRWCCSRCDYEYEVR